MGFFGIPIAKSRGWESWRGISNAKATLVSLTGQYGNLGGLNVISMSESLSNRTIFLFLRTGFGQNCSVRETVTHRNYSKSAQISKLSCWKDQSGLFVGNPMPRLPSPGFGIGKLRSPKIPYQSHL